MLVPERYAPVTGRSFDSLAYAKHREAVGFTRPQAEALAEEQGKLIDERLATKFDLTEMKGQLASEIEALRLQLEAKIEILRLEVKRDFAETKRDLAETKADLIKWVLGISFGQAAMILAVLKFHG